MLMYIHSYVSTELFSGFSFVNLISWTFSENIVAHEIENVLLHTSKLDEPVHKHNPDANKTGY